MRISCQGHPITTCKPEKLGSEPRRAIAGIDKSSGESQNPYELRGYAEPTLLGPKPERLRQCTRVRDTGGVFPAFAPGLCACYAGPQHASKMVRESAHV